MNHALCIQYQLHRHPFLNHCLTFHLYHALHLLLHSNLKTYKPDPSLRHHEWPNIHWLLLKYYFYQSIHLSIKASLPLKSFLHPYSFRINSTNEVQYHLKSVHHKETYLIHDNRLHNIPQTLLVEDHLLFLHYLNVL